MPKTELAGGKITLGTFNALSIHFFYRVFSAWVTHGEIGWFFTCTAHTFGVVFLV